MADRQMDKGNNSKQRHKPRYFAAKDQQSQGQEQSRQGQGQKQGRQVRTPKPEKFKAGQKRRRSRTPHDKDKVKDKVDFSVEETAGFVKFESDEEGERRLSQADITAAVDVTSASKHFDLTLKDFGPYSINYSRNGRHLALAGSRGHMATFDWQTKRLMCEFNVMETVNCVRFLHQETLFAAAQRSGVYVYDNQGIEIHALQRLDSVLRMEFLPFHMLLVTANAKGYLGYTDVSMGTSVAGICTGLGRLDTMTQNPANAIIHLGHAAGTVTLWQPSCKSFVMKMLCHKAAVKGIAVDPSGRYMATTGVDKRVKVFDLRTQRPLSSTHLPAASATVAFSQRRSLAVAPGNIVKVYNDACRRADPTPYLSHLCAGAARQLQFCPFEDVLGVGHQRGFTSLLIPGSGEPNLDALELNPLATKKQRQNAEVKLLLDKLKPEMISLKNWMNNLAPGSTPDASAPKPKRKVGKKQREEEDRERRRAAKRQGGGREEATEYNPLARF